AFSYHFGEPSTHRVELTQQILVQHAAGQRPQQGRLSAFSMIRVRKREQAPRTPHAAAQWPSAWDFAKRLECVRLAGAFHGSWSRCMRKSESKPSRDSRTGGTRPP